MRILVVSSYLPYPLYSGGQVRLYNLIKELSARHEITLVCEKRSNQTAADIKAMETICKKVICVDRRKQWSLENMLKSGLSKHSFLVTGHTLPAMKEALEKELAKNDFDVIHVETYYVAQNLPLTSVPIVLAEHNIEYSVYQKFAAKLPPALRPLLLIDVLKIRKEEEALWKSVDGLVAVSDEDKRVMEKIGVHPRLVSNGVNTEEFGLKNVKKALTQKEKKILFIGDFKWIQNMDSITFIIKEIWPHLRQGFGGQAVKLWVVGRKIPDSVKGLTDDPAILFDEASSAKSTPELFQEASILLAPIRVGGGTSYKILESMSCGTPVVTMQMSADAIAAKDNREVMVGQNAQELASKTARLLKDPELYEKISHAGRKLIEERYTWKMIAKQLEAVYEDVAK